MWEERGGVCYAASGTLVVGEEDPDPQTHSTNEAASKQRFTLRFQT